MLLDTGSSVSIVNKQVLCKIPNVKIDVCSKPVLRLANSSLMHPIGKCKLEVLYNGISLYIDFLVYNNLPFEFLLGLDFCSKTKLCIDFNNMNDTYYSLYGELPFYQSDIECEPSENYLKVNKTMEISPMSSNWVEVSSDQTIPSEFLFESRKLFNMKSDLMPINSINRRISKNTAKVLVMNNTNRKICLFEDTKIGKTISYDEEQCFHQVSLDENVGSNDIKDISSVTSLVSSSVNTGEGIDLSSNGNELSFEDQLDVHKKFIELSCDLTFNIGNNLSNIEKCEINNFLVTRRKLFARDLSELTQTNLIEHKIRTVSHNPISKRPYRASPKEKAIIESQVNKMLDANIIRESKSPYSAPVVIVIKRDGSPRFCVDFRGLNEVTISDSYPIPRTDELLDCFNGAKIFSTLDMASGYWQVPIAKEDIEKSAFTTHVGHYEFLRAPFGMKTIPETYQRIN